MSHDDRFDELVDSLGGFHRSWLVYLGVELGLFAAIRAAGPGGIRLERAGRVDGHRRRGDRCLGVGRRRPRPRAARGRAPPDGRGRRHDPARRRAPRLPRRPVRPRGRRVDGLGRDARLLPDGRPDRASTRPLSRGHRAPDPPGHRGLLPGGARGPAAARRRPVARRPRGGHPLRRRPLAHRDGPPVPGPGARRRRVRGGLGRPCARRVAEAGLCRPDRRSARRRPTQPGDESEFDLAYFQYALHQLHDAVAALRAGWGALRPGGRLLVLDWPLPSSPDEFRTPPRRADRGRPARRALPGHRARASREQFLRLDRRGRPARADDDRPAVRAPRSFVAERAPAD